MRISDETLAAYVDGELDDGQRARVDAAARTDAALARRIQLQQRLRQTMAGTFSALMAEEPPERLLRAIGTPRGSAEVLDLDEIRRRRAAPTTNKVRSDRWIPWAVAATVALVIIGAGLKTTRRNPPPVSESLVAGAPGAMVAEGRLAGALNAQLASAGVGAADLVHIGVSFRRADGRYCRTFQVATSEGFAGLACRDPAGWRLRAVVADALPVATPTYRQAGSDTPPAISATVDGLIVGAPLDARQEAAARAAGWTN